MASRNVRIFKLNTERLKSSVNQAEELEELKSLKVLNLLKQNAKALIDQEIELQAEICEEFEKLSAQDQPLKYEDFDLVKTMNTCIDALMKIQRALVKKEEDLENEMKPLIELKNTGATGEFSSSVPIIKLPIFEDGFVEWMEFFDLFKAQIDSRKNLSKTEKLIHLKNSIKGAALNKIKGLGIVESNYEIALKILKDYYESERQIIFQTIDKLLDFPKIKTISRESLNNMYDHFRNSYSVLKNMKRTTPGNDEFFVRILIRSLPQKFIQQFYLTLNTEAVPSVSSLFDFLEKQIRSWNADEGLIKHDSSDSKLHPTILKSKNMKIKNFSTTVKNNSIKCFWCNRTNHCLKLCFNFKKLSFNDKMNFIFKRKLCKVCLKPNHDFLSCKAIKCHCGNFHNPLLHASKMQLDNYFKNIKTATSSTVKNAIDQNLNVSNENVNVSNENVNVSDTPEKTYSTNLHRGLSRVLLGTAIVQVPTANEMITARCLIDTASQSNFITNSLASKLQLKVIKQNDIPVYGLGSSLVSSVTGSVKVKISPLKSTNVEIDCPFFTVNKICDDLDTFYFDINSFPHLRDLQLADPGLHEGGTVDMLLGSQTVAQILRGGVRKGDEKSPIAIESVLGWILLGNCPLTLKDNSVSRMKSFVTLEYLSKKLWSLDHPTEVDPVKYDQCERHFKNNYFRLPSGRFSVALPYKEPHTLLGESRQGALKRFLSLEKKFEMNAEFKLQYSNSIRDLLKLDFAEIVPNSVVDRHCYYLPHHAVIREQSLSTKMRIVFDGSAKSDNGISLNHILMTGRPLQSDIRSLLTRFRNGPIAFTFDLKKMYSMIFINEGDRDFLRFIWRFEPLDPVQTFRLKTLPFGLKSSPFLALRVLKELASVDGFKFPTAQRVLNNCLYMDDGFISVHSIKEAETIILEVKELLKLGGFLTDKWASNNVKITNLVKDEGNYSKIIAENPVTNTLGLIWNTKLDSFQISYIPNIMVSLTKRKLLSELAKTFDPLGFMGPVLIKFKIIFQQLCKEKITWDQPVSDRVNLTWIHYQEDLKLLEKLYISRFIGVVRFKESFFLLGYCDASERAYAGVAYLVRGTFAKTLQLSEGWLLGSRTRVAPLKVVSLPRLELAGALLLSEFLNFLMPSIEVPLKGIICLTDSMIALNWIKSEPFRWQTFVANRIAKIQENLPEASWQYVQSNSNLADMASRGVYLRDLIDCEEWWKGPGGNLPFSPPPPLSDIQRQDCLKEERKAIEVFSTHRVYPLINSFSSHLKLIRVVATMLRWLSKIRERKISIKFSQPLSASELRQASLICVKLAQRESFPQEIKSLEEHKEVKWSHGLMGLNPFLDSKGIIRANDRLSLLKNKQIEKYPIILDYQNTFTFNLIKYYHELYFHAGMRFLINFIRTRYYIPRLTRLVKKVIYKCLTCFKGNPRCAKQQMAPLPITRVTPSRPFTNCSVDYAGPFFCKNRVGRKFSIEKSYVLVLVCHATKAIHLELVSNLTSENFIASFKRFIARRGLPHSIFSDCGRTFMGANAQLKKDLKSIVQLEPSSAEYLANLQVEWNFHPPYAPHFSGLVEAAVKSFKVHLYKIGKNYKYSYEELTTLLCQIEAILNSRPLCVMSNRDGNDILTPGHFLTGSTLVSIPEPNLSEIKENYLSRWQLVQSQMQGFWRSWSKEYINSLRKRTKWREIHAPLKEGQLVLISMPTPPTEWPLGRIETLIAGPDGLIRVVDVRTTKGLVRRAITKIAPLPIE